MCSPEKGVRCFCEWPRTRTIGSGSVGTDTGEDAGPYRRPWLCLRGSVWAVLHAQRGWQGGSVGCTCLVFGALNTGVRCAATHPAYHTINSTFQKHTHKPTKKWSSTLQNPQNMLAIILHHSHTCLFITCECGPPYVKTNTFTSCHRNDTLPHVVQRLWEASMAHFWSQI